MSNRASAAYYHPITDDLVGKLSGSVGNLFGIFGETVRIDERFFIGGQQIRKDQTVALMMSAANRDPQQFSDPDRLDIGRSPNRHLAFGAGKHTCLGNTLARIEGRVAVGKFIEKFARIELNGPAQLNGRARFRGHDVMPVKVR